MAYPGIHYPQRKLASVGMKAGMCWDALFHQSFKISALCFSSTGFCWDKLIEGLIPIAIPTHAMSTTWQTVGSLWDIRKKVAA
jgi:hypothetical protein